MSMKYPIIEDKILVALDSKYVYISKKVFAALFENSHVYYKTAYSKALEENRIKFTQLKELSRSAGIPYSLFFAPLSVVEKNIEKNNQVLFEGVPDGLFSIAGRGNLRLQDVNLIIKDIQKRQILMSKYRPKTEDNKMLSIRKSDDVEVISRKIIETLSIDMDKFRSYKTKEKSYQFLVESLEKENIMISRSRQGYMPQSINRNVMFSGFVVKNRRFPVIFLYTKDEDSVGDPVGRRIFTIFLLLACVANKRFVITSYDQSIRDIIKNFEYEVAEEILMPRGLIDGFVVDSIEDIKKLSDAFKVTPSMATMRLRRLGIITKEEFDNYYDVIGKERKEAEKLRINGGHFDVKDTTKVVTYNSRLFCSEVIGRVAAGKMGAGEARKLLLFNKKPISMVRNLMDAI